MTIKCPICWGELVENQEVCMLCWQKNTVSEQTVWWFKWFLKKYLSSKGRLNRHEFHNYLWKWFVGNIVIISIGIWVFYLLGKYISNSSFIWIILIVLCLLFVIASIFSFLSFLTRRIHDQDRNWIFLLLFFIPLVWIIYFIILLFTKWTQWSNKYWDARLLEDWNEDYLWILWITKRVLLLLFILLAYSMKMIVKEHNMLQFKDKMQKVQGAVFDKEWNSTIMDSEWNLNQESLQNIKNMADSEVFNQVIEEILQNEINFEKRVKGLDLEFKEEYLTDKASLERLINNRHLFNKYSQEYINGMKEYIKKYKISLNSEENSAQYGMWTKLKKVYEVVKVTNDYWASCIKFYKYVLWALNDEYKLDDTKYNNLVDDLTAKEEIYTTKFDEMMKYNQEYGKYYYNKFNK